ncbi:hypothetical protein ACH5RR_032195 [Cinchona calisaya]|uniref:TF-B3 domain-containing protein n=1 Tax=Cinchona calisaya TaxID=153742 RepID=A0ABD2YIH9_9GENT
MIRKPIKGASAKFLCKASSDRGVAMKNQSTKKMGIARRDKEYELRVKRTFDYKYPYFIASMHSYGFLCSHTVYVPAAFSRTYLNDCPNFIGIRDFENRYWSVSTILTNGKVMRLGSGWKKFEHDKELAPGDICVFELTESSDVVLKLNVLCVRDFTAGPSN